MLQLFVPITLFVIMFALGLGLRWESRLRLRDRPALFARVVFGSCVLVPLVALLLLRLPLSHELSTPVRFAIALMAICPSAPLTLRKADRAGADPELAAMLQVLAALVAVVSVPLLADLFRATYEIEGWNIGPLAVAQQVGQAQILPLFLGLLLRRRRPALADRIEAPLEKIGNALLLLLIGLVLFKAAPLLVPFLLQNGLAVLFIGLMVLASLAIGYVLAAAEPRQAISSALVTSMRNPGLALLFASTYAPQMTGVKIAILVYLLVTVVLSLPVLRLRRGL
ncbi:MAG: bile acid:sodium symporter [Cyanobacteriota bacterium]|jgi:BASS family bile acid:Na+ symporter